MVAPKTALHIQVVRDRDDLDFIAAERVPRSQRREHVEPAPIRLALSEQATQP